MSKSPRIVKEFTNKFGHQFKPGDPCITVTNYTGRTQIARCQYVGVVPTRNWDYQTKNYVDGYRVQVKKVISVYQAVYSDTKEPAVWPYDKTRTIDYDYVSKEKICTLWNNNILPESASVDDVAKVVY